MTQVELTQPTSTQAATGPSPVRGAGAIGTSRASSR